MSKSSSRFTRIYLNSEGKFLFLIKNYEGIKIILDSRVHFYPTLSEAQQVPRELAMKKIYEQKNKTKQRKKTKYKSFKDRTLLFFCSGKKHKILLVLRGKLVHFQISNGEEITLQFEKKCSDFKEAQKCLNFTKNKLIALGFEEL